MLLLRRNSLFSFILCATFFTACGGGSANKDNNSEISSPESALEDSTKIVNGALIDQNDLPPVKRLFVVVPGEEPIFACSGTFISPNHFVTAAHCLNFEGVGTLAPNFIQIETDPGRLVPAVGVATVPEFSHQQYLSPEVQFPVLPFDLGIVLIAEPYDGPTVPVLSTFPIPGEQIVIAGYGQINTDIPSDQRLRVGLTSIDVVSPNDGAFFWAFDRADESNTCQGDSGGPAFVIRGDSFVLAGVTSTGAPNCEIGSVSVDTMISHPVYLDFLVQVTGGLFSIY